MKFDTSEEGIRQIISKGESETVEFKLKLPPEHQIARILTGFANTSGGILLVGVNDNQEVIGLNLIEVLDYIDRLRKIGKSLFNSSIESGSKTLDGRNVVYAIIDPAPDYLKPIAISTGEVFRRSSSKIIKVPQIVNFKPPTNPCQLSGFVAMSFRNEEEPALVDYFEAMKRSVKETNLPIDFVRIDLVEGDYEISQKIMDKIKDSDFVLADFTLSPRNVYFEVGFARGCDKPIIQTAREGTALEFDTRNWRTIFYKNATELEVKLKKALIALYQSISQHK